MVRVKIISAYPGRWRPGKVHRLGNADSNIAACGVTISHWYEKRDGVAAEITCKKKACSG